MIKASERIGQTFGYYTIQSIIYRPYKPTQANVICKCGAKRVVPIHNMVNGTSKSCACWCTERMVKMNFRHGLIKENRRVFNIWHKMIRRCEVKKERSYSAYGARGISVCKSWHNCRTFYKWALKNGYTSNLTLERIDVNGNYCPKNCTWIPLNMQCWNTTRSIGIDKINDIRKEIKKGLLVKEATEKFGIGRSSYYRIKKNPQYGTLYNLTA